MKMNRFFRFTLYVLICLGILLFPQMVELCTTVFYSLGDILETNCIIVALCTGGALFLSDFLYHYCRKGGTNKVDKYKTSASHFYFDSPTTKDIFNRRSYACLLLDKIYSSFYVGNSSGEKCKHSFVIHIGEHYGQGKTSFLMMLEEEAIRRQNEKPVVYVSFEPWLCDTEAGIINEFFYTFRDQVGKCLPKLKSTINEYLQLLLSSIDFSNRGFTIDFTTITKEGRRPLKVMHDKIREELQKIDRPVIISIDDVDRLQSKELMMVLKIIRDTADFPNVFYIVTADNEHLKKMLSMQFVDNADTYLKKFFNLEFQLPANENVAFDELLKIIELKFDEKQIEEKKQYIQQMCNVPYIKEAFPNLRDVYRFVNAYFLTIDSMTDVEQLNLFDLFLLTMIQILNPEYYQQLRDNSLNILDVVRQNNDILLSWKEDLNIVKHRNDKVVSQKFREISEKQEVNKPISAEEKEIVPFADIIEKTKISSNEIVPEIMNLLFEKTNKKIEANKICRYNMYFRYFANTAASYMVSRLEVVSMLQFDEDEYRTALDLIFKKNRDELFLSEYVNAIPYVKDKSDTEILHRFFIFIEISYKCSRNIVIDSLIHSQAGYEGWVSNEYQLLQILEYFYSRSKYPWGSVEANEKYSAFIKLCNQYDRISILMVCVNIFSHHLGFFFFDRSNLAEFSKILVTRFFKERIERSNGNIGDEEADTITLIKKEREAEILWNDLFLKYLCNHKEECLNILSKLVIFYPEVIEWSFNFHEAILGEYQLQGNHVLAQLEKAYPDKKDVFNSLLNLHNHNTSTLQHIDGLETNPFIQMAKERQQQN